MDAASGGVAALPGHDHPSTRPAGDTTGADSAGRPGQQAVRDCRRCGRPRRVPDQIARTGYPTCHECTAAHREAYNRAYSLSQLRCSGCGGPKPEGQGRRYCPSCAEARRREAAQRRAPARYCRYCGVPVAPRRHACEDCKLERKRAANRRWIRLHRAESAAAQRRYAARHPERAAAATRRWYAEVKRDPERYAALLETHRMGERLRAERNGHPLPPVPEDQYPAASPHWRLEDPEPLRELVRDWTRGSDQAELARTAGVSDRLIYRLLHEDSGITVAAADRLLMAMGLHLDLLEGAA
jgi:hypothetical protein